MRTALFVILAACGSAPRPPVVGNDGTPPRPPPVGERARVARYTHGWIRLDADPIVADHPEAANEVWPVTAATADRARVTIDRDDARLALWMPRADLAPSIARETRVTIADAPHGTETGVVAYPGAEVRARQGAQVTIAGDGMTVVGEVPADAIADTWTPVDAPAPSVDLTLYQGDVVRASADARGVVLATVDDSTSAHAVSERDGWTEVIAGGAQLAVHGFVPTPTPDALGGLIGTAVGSAYGISDTGSVDVPRGACLYDDVHGGEIGVELVTRTRYAFATDDPAWWQVYVDTPWGLATVGFHQGATCPIDGR